MSKTVSSFSVTGITGPRGCGKSELARLLCKFCNFHSSHNWTVAIDSSSIISQRSKENDEFGISLQQEMRQHQGNGKNIDDGLIIQACLEWINNIKQSDEHIKHVFLAGFPRSESQIDLIRSFDGRIIHIEASKSLSHHGVALRTIVDKVVRNDSHPEALDNSRTEYEQKIIPALWSAQDITIKTERQEPLEKRFRKSLEHLNITASMRSKLLIQFNKQDHPIHRDISEIEKKDKTHREVTTKLFRDTRQMSLTTVSP